MRGLNYNFLLVFFSTLPAFLSINFRKNINAQRRANDQYMLKCNLLAYLVKIIAERKVIAAKPIPQRSRFSPLDKIVFI